MTRDQKPEASDWTRMWFKTNKVWVAVDAQGKPVTKDGKVLIKYQLKQDYEYWVKENNVSPIDAPPPKTQLQKKRKTRNKKSANDKTTVLRNLGTNRLTRTKYAYSLTGLLPEIQAHPALACCCAMGGMRRKSHNLSATPPTILLSLKPSKSGCPL